MKQLLSIFLLLLPCTAAFAQQKPARSYYEEARQAGALPTLPYVCFRSAEETSQNPGVEAPYTDSTFAMLATSQQIGETIKSKTNSHMNDADQRTLWRFAVTTSCILLDLITVSTEGDVFLSERIQMIRQRRIGPLKVRPVLSISRSPGTSTSTGAPFVSGRHLPSVRTALLTMANVNS